jgi:hypothetical protein
MEMERESRRESVASVDVENLDDIPDFSTETEERAFWASHRVSEDVYNQVLPGEDDEEGLLHAPPPHSAESSALRLGLE